MNPARIVVILFILQISGYPVVMAQRYLTTLGAVAELRVDSATVGILAGDFNGDGREDLAAYGHDRVLCFYSDSNTVTFRNTTWIAPRILKRVAAARCDRDRRTDLVALTDDQSTIRAFLATGKGRFSQSWTVHCDHPVEQFMLADLDGDRNVDIIVFGKKSLGLTVFRGKGNGTFRKAERLLTDYSFGALLVTSLRDNGIIDVIGANWISNQILVFPGFGTMRFSDPLVIQCASEPTRLVSAYLDNDSNADIIASFADHPALRVFSGDGLGEFHPTQDIVLTREVSQLLVGDVNGDMHDDLLLLPRGAQEIELLLNNGEGKLVEKIRYSAGQWPSDVVLFRQPTASYLGAAVLDSSRALLRLFRSSRAAEQTRTTRAYALGQHPSTVLPVDLNRDGWNDLLVANTGSKAIALFLNDGRGHLGGQITFDTPTAPATLRYLARSDSMGIVVSTRGSSGMISLLELNLRTLSHASFSLPVQGSVELLSAAMDSTRKFVHILALERDSAASRSAIIEFEQVAPTRFVERARPLPSSPLILCATVGDVNGDGLPDITYCTSGRVSHTWELRQCLNHGVFGPSRHLYSFPDSDGVPTALVNGDLNDDGHDDVLLAVRGTKSTLYAILAQEDSSSDGPRALPGAIDIAGADGVKIVDVNCDGLNDILLYNSLTAAIEVYLGDGAGGFAPAVTVFHREGIGGFALTDVDNDNIPDLVVTDEREGLLDIVPLGRYICK